MGEISTFQSLQNENPSKIDEITPNRPKNDPFCHTGTPHLRKKTADDTGKLWELLSLQKIDRLTDRLIDSDNGGQGYRK